jgi:undecaprenyl-diphosphatase
MFLSQLIILSLVQGLTEFLPVSSSGHLVLVPYFFGWKDQGCLMDVAVHVGTLGSVLIYFWRDVWSMIPGFLNLLKGKVTKGGQLFLLLCIGTIPAVIFGFLLKRYGLDHVRTLKVIAWTMVGYAVVLYIADKFAPETKGIKEVTGPKAFWVGVAQALALIPGTSRSGACMTMMRFMGFTRADAAKFSFLLSIPSIIAAATLTTIDAIKEGAFASITHDASIAVGISFLAGLGAINFMLTWLKLHDFTPFVIYRLGLGGVLLSVAYAL